MAISRRRLLLASAGLLVSACARGQGARWGDGLVPVYARPDRDEWPDAFRELPPEIQAMYRYAVANREVLQYIPCFCGCVNGGHGSNFDCYVREVATDGRVRLDTMSFG
ncbi:MAG: PCYCGC motif-containing (lipo)protein [Solirubrobacteraceae bacterium]